MEAFSYSYRFLPETHQRLQQIDIEAGGHENIEKKRPEYGDGGGG